MRALRQGELELYTIYKMIIYSSQKRYTLQCINFSAFPRCKHPSHSRGQLQRSLQNCRCTVAQRRLEHQRQLPPVRFDRVRRGSDPPSRGHSQGERQGRPDHRRAAGPGLRREPVKLFVVNTSVVSALSILLFIPSFILY